MSRAGILPILFFLTLISAAAQAQPASKEAPIVKLGEISHRFREVESSPTPLRLIELYVEVVNQSRVASAPANSIKVIVSQKEVIFADKKPAEEFAFPPQEMTFSQPLPPLNRRVLIFGFSLPREKIESITFEVELNPP
ncbi:MAG: hypothetical protein N3G78_05890, partial [Desulfobacterota bacterium]|nr:hypothetical protein [Thermodesulfobacteriota bacterium]